MKVRPIKVDVPPQLVKDDPPKEEKGKGKAKETKEEKTEPEAKDKAETQEKQEK